MNSLKEAVQMLVAGAVLILCNPLGWVGLVIFFGGLKLALH